MSFIEQKDNQSLPQATWTRKIVIPVIMAIMIIQFILLKSLYPFSNYMPSSYSYLETADMNLDINIWPVGYSKFLRFFSAFTHSDTALTAFQYFFLTTCSLYFAFTTSRIFQLSKFAKVLLITILVVNPLFLYVSNYVSPDALFAGLSLLWFTQLLLLREKPHLSLLFSHLLTLFIVFTFAYHALYFPLLTIIVLLSTRQKKQVKLSGLVLIILSLGLYIVHVRHQYRQLTGAEHFAPVSGWLIASNAMAMYSNIAPEQKSPLPDRFLKLHQLLEGHEDSLQSTTIPKHTINNNYYFNDSHSPLNQYLHIRLKADTLKGPSRSWVEAASLYSDYGWTLIRRYPYLYFRSIVVPGIEDFITPPVELLSVYNMDTDTVPKLTQKWFNYKTSKITSNDPDPVLVTLDLYPVIGTIIQFSFLTGLLIFILLKGLQRANKAMRFLIWLYIVWWLFEFLLSVLTSTVTLRHQIFPAIMCLPATLFFMEFSIKTEWAASQERKKILSINFYAVRLSGKLTDKGKLKTFRKE